jgi:hypothetical protein
MSLLFILSHLSNTWFDGVSILEGDVRKRADKSAESCPGDRQESLGGSHTSGDKSRPTVHPQGERPV